MKILTILAIVITISCVFTKETSSANKNEINLTKKQISIVDHFPDTPVHGSVINDAFTLQHQANALIMAMIPRSINNNLNTGKIEDATTFTTDKTYYDGSNNLNAIHVICNVYTIVPTTCVKQSGCGWCGENKTCVSGSSTGPLSPCMRNTFLYSMPSPEWNPLKAGTINILAFSSKGQLQNTLTPEPNLRKIDVYNPYK